MTTRRAPLNPVTEATRHFMGAAPDRGPRGPVVRAVHRLAREIVWPFVALMALGHRFGRRLLQTEYVVTGRCGQRGDCCHHVLMEWSPVLDRFPLLGRIAMWKLTRFYAFFDRGYSWEVQDGLLVRVLGCHALRSDGRCGEYRLRPLFCRTYPEVPLVGRPQVLPGCGFDFRRRDGAPEAREELVQIGALKTARLPPTADADRPRGPGP